MAPWPHRIDVGGLDARIGRSVPAVFLGVGVLFALALAATPFVDAPAATSLTLLGAWAVTAGTGLGGAAIAWRRPPPPGWGNHAVGVLGAVTVVATLLLVAEAGPTFVFALAAALVAFALVLLSLPWMAGLCGLALGSWMALAAAQAGGDDWTPRTMNLLAFCIVAIVVQATRINVRLRLQVLQAREAERAAEEHEMARIRQLNEQRRRIVNMTAHELATPLTPVMLDVQMLAKAQLDPEARRLADRLQRNLARLQQAIHVVVTAARKDEDAARVREDRALEALGQGPAEKASPPVLADAVVDA